jgi:beta-phosphoglucomutase-like phosphatase (HAD superfamily)
MTRLEQDLECVAKFKERNGYDKLDLRAALFDMDGTLYDSMRNHAEAWSRLCAENNLQARREEFFLYEGRTGASTINILINRNLGRDATDEEKKELYKRKTEIFVELPPVEVMPGAQSLVKTVCSYDLRCVLVTGSGQSSLINRLNKEFPDVFADNMRVTSHDVVHGKPAPEPYLKAMQLAGVEPFQAVAFENAPMGVKSAADSGALTVAVVTGPIPREAMIEAGATIVYDSMPQCAEEFPKLLKILKQ